MITTLDTLSWSPELFTGSADFLEVTLPASPPGGPTLFVISNVRTNGTAPLGFGYGFGAGFGSASGFSFEVLQSAAFPPAPGPGSTFAVVASYTFPQPNLTFDPAVAYDTSGAHPLIHIVGTRNTPTGATTSSNQYSDIVKFTYDTVTQVLTGPVVLSSGTRIRSAYDIAVLPNGNQVAVMSLAEPTMYGVATVTSVAAVSAGGSPPTYSAVAVTAGNVFVPGQWVLLDNLTNATFLNGQLLQVLTSSATQFTAAFATPLNYGPTPEPGSPTATPVGDSLLAIELGTADSLPPISATIIDSSPARSGNFFDGVSLVNNGSTVELYYQSHPKVVTFLDQVFTIKATTYASGTWSPLPATQITTYTARYSDNRLTVLADAANNRYLSQTYWNQFNHPYGLVGNVLLGYKPFGGSWAFRATLGTFAGGSIVQSTLALAQDGAVSLMYLLQPFDQIANPPSTVAAAYPLQVASVNPLTLGLTNEPGFYNSVSFTWLRGTKSLIDNESVWSLVGEREVLTAASGESHAIPVLPGPYAIQVANHSDYFENIGVTSAAGAFIQVVTAPKQGQYTVEPSTGLYTFNSADAGTQVSISYNYISGILPAYASSFNVPPVAELAPESVTVWRGGSFYSVDLASITQIEIGGNSITVVANNDFVPGDEVALYNIAATPVGSPPAVGSSAAFLNGVTLTVLTASPTQFTAPLSAELAATFVQQFGFGFNFGFNFGGLYIGTDTGIAANLIAGDVTFSAAGSTDADSDAMEFLWSENDPDLADVTLAPNGSQATLNVARHVGPASRMFNVGVAVVDLFPDLVTQRHSALVVSNVLVSGGNITLTFVPPGGAGFGSVFGAHFGSSVPSGQTIVPIVGDQVMLFGMVLSAPLAPTIGQIAGGSLPAQNGLSVIITYVNNTGETVGSGNSVINVAANSLFAVNSPGNNGSATAYNVYAGVPGGETLQTPVPQSLGSTFVEPTAGLRASFQTPPLTNTAMEQALNDEVLTIASTTADSMTAPFTLAGTFGIDFGIDFGNLFGGNYLASLTGFAINQFQWDIANVFVPQNAAPTITFPDPPWGVGNVLDVTLARNTQVTITPTPNLSDPATQFPVVYAGIYDPDDLVSYLWTQTGGTPVTVVGGRAGSSFSFLTNGVSISGETLTFTLTVNDGVNPPVTASFSVNAAAVNLANTKDTLQLSRSVWSQTASVSGVSILDGVASITATTNFLAGEPVRFSGLTNATFLNDVGGFFVKTTTSGLGFGEDFGFAFGVYQQFTFSTTLPDYPFTADTGTVYATTPISQRNTPQVWSPLDISVLFSDLNSVKRVSVLDGSDRYIVISPYSVLVYGVFPSANPVAVLLRKLITPERTTILDAVHTEQDYTLVLDNAGNIFRYTTAPLISTDNPDTTLVISNSTPLSFADPDLDSDVNIMTTQSFAGNRIVVLSGEQGAVLLQLNTTTLAVQNVLTFTVADRLLYGANAIQFVRWVNMDSMRTGRVLLGSVVYESAAVSQVAIANNTLTIAAPNTFATGNRIVLSGMTNATFLNGVAVTVTSATPTQFEASIQYGAGGGFGADFGLDFGSQTSGSYGPTIETSGFAESQTSGTTYETLVDLAQGQIVGTWDKSKLRNQFVQTGEILFTPDSTYSGAPIPPVLLQPTASVQGLQTFVTLTWQQERPDLITSYIVSYAIETQVFGTVPLVAPYTFQVPIAFAFTADEGAADTTSPITITSVHTDGFGGLFGYRFGYGNEVTVTGNNNFSVGQSVTIGGLTGIPALIGQTLVISSSSPTQFTAPFVHTTYGLPNTVASVTVASNVLTIQTGTPHAFLPGTQVSFNSLLAATFLNGQTVTIVGTTTSSFTANFISPNYGPLSDIGNVVDADTGIGYVSVDTPLVAVTGTPLTGQYAVTPAGLYTFNAAQAGHAVILSIRQSFNTLQSVGSGATKSITLPMAAGQTYFFEVEAFGLDGASGESNVVSISI